ncbi:hypothetical protein GXP70_05730 [Paenibacillus lycopersici]|uniref:Uncharacterized protein n=1 Tax=Paenibacillus lycopersici TaxID=2704462 RepID=A0A6C0FW39_9BACL|nr:hypothetical protein [Paenibacillus lycopersici]QHT59504.1 hypothetical protein GXP70_05730 [Paenibacillus lycopersici]
MRKKPNKKRAMSASKAIRLFGAAAAAVPLAMSVPAAAGAQSVQAPQLKASMDDLLQQVYSASLVAGNSFAIDLNDVFRDAGEYTYSAFVQFSSVADVGVIGDGAGKSLRIAMKKAGTTQVDLMARAPGTENYVHERFTLTVQPNYALNSAGTADIGDVIRYYKAHAGEFKTTEDYRRLLQAAVSSSAPPVNHPPVVFLRNAAGSASADVQQVHLTPGSHDTETFDLSDYFSDEDGDALSYRIIEGNDYDHPASGTLAYGRIAEGSRLELHASGAASMDVVVAASDDRSAETATMTFHVEAQGAFILHSISDDNDFSIRSGQSATIDLSRMFEATGEGDVRYEYAVEDGYYVDPALEGPYLYLNTTGSPSVSHITVKASGDNGAHWTAQTVTIRPSDGSKLTDKTYPGSQATATIDLAAYFDGSYTFEPSVPEGPATAAVNGSVLTLGLQAGTSSQVKLAAADGSGLTIYDRFRVVSEEMGGNAGTVIDKHSISGDNAFSIRTGQSAAIDLSRMFEVDGPGEVSYDYTVDDGYYVSPSLDGSKLYLQTTGSSSVTHLTVHASIAGSEISASQTITIRSGDGSKLTDKTYPGPQETATIDVADYFEGTYTFEPSVPEGPATAAIDGSVLTLGLQADTSSLVRLAADDGTGLTIYDSFQVTVGNPGIVDGPFIKHAVSDDNAFSMSQGQWATIDLSKMFEAAATDEVIYDYAVDDGDYIDTSLSGPYLNLQTTGSSSVTRITVMARKAGDQNWVTQSIEISPSGGSELTDVTYPYSETSATIDLADYFEGNYAFDSKVEGAALTTTINGSLLTLNLRSGSSAWVEAVAKDEHGLFIYDRFQVAVDGMAAQDIGTIYMPYGGDAYAAFVYPQEIFPDASEFRVTGYDDRLQDLSRYSDWKSDGFLEIYASERYEGHLYVDVEARDGAGTTGRYRIMISQNSAPTEEGLESEERTVFVKKGGEPTGLYFSDPEEDAIQSLAVSSNDPALFYTEVPSGNDVVYVHGIAPGSGQMTVHASDGKEDGTASYDYSVYVYDEQVSFTDDDWGASFNLSNTSYLDGLDTSDPSALEVTMSDNSLLSDVNIGDNVLTFVAEPDPGYSEMPMYGRELVKLTITDGSHSKDIYFYVGHDEWGLA